MRGELFRCLLFLSIGFSTGISATPDARDSLTNKPSLPPPPKIPQQILPLISQAEQSFAQGNLGKADALYSKALAVAPNVPSLLVSAAAIKTKMGNLEESRIILRKALSLDLDNAPAWQLLGMNALEQKKDQEAFAFLTQATLLNDNNPRAHNYLGMAAGRKGWSEASEQELRRAVELDPRYADANFNLAVLYLGRTPPLIELARRHYQRALDLGSKRDPAIEKIIAKAVAEHPADSSTSILQQIR
jgi:tetratricopeptide (TPR) repeat protein